ncbi:OmpA family protein [Serratia ficaria]|uniref:Outer membrane porin F n=1 Tax=Serratia ficaria TaxID=61651 RepID=A0A240BUX0_SERFI|nr:OmpA family protein [Serratia ficaria]REF45394.1 outer membrane protein OmpA-like peptidoglycan-associated protein [Serratia ficaria]CAI0890561.1 Outer membrane porin F precursor [Serratia ficaria]CAI0890954.1 Outer membrane porin F precursor [Serratia ficaria]CAI0942322.1 Outer membrane porin F precursor [Serratia ficaria]CAI2017198.1 Outer membrane porin F precursor [Serratia ficaria]
MSPAQQRGLALWAVLLSAVVCLVFLPASRRVSVLVFLVVLGLIAASWYIASRRVQHDVALHLDDLPEATYRQPVVLVCGDLPLAWRHQSPVLTVTQGCWIRVEGFQDLEQAARQVLWQRPDWGRQLSVMVSVCPQKLADCEALTSRLLALRWQISQLRKDTGHSVPLVLNGQVGSAMTNDLLWQAAIPGEGMRVWRESSAPSSIAAWVTTGGTPAMQQQVLMNSLMSWFHQHVEAVFLDENPDVPAIAPAAVLWGMGPILAGSLASSAWTAWLSRHTAMQQVTGWQPVGTDSTVISPFPDFILPLLPEGRGLTSRGRAWRCALGIFTLAAIAALLGSGWNNRQLLHRVSFDIARYDRIPMDDYGPKADAVAVLREDAAQLDGQARNGVPARMSLGLYQGERLRMPVLDAIRSYVPPPPPSKPQPKPAPKIVRLDSMSLFDSGKYVLKAGSTKMLINSLVGIKAKPGWLIVVAGHTDNTGNPALNQALSRKRAAAVRDWMRDTGDVPESCFAVQGHGESRPVATNDTPEGRALNRRVDISLVPQADACRIPGNTPTSSQDDGVTDN